MAEDYVYRTSEQLVTLAVDVQGLACEDPDALAKYLRRTNFYRFNGYARQFQRDPRYGDERFVEGTSLEDVQAVIAADSRLRRLLFEQLGAIEIAIRSLLADELEGTYGSGAFYLEEERYLDFNGKPDAITSGILRDLSRTGDRSVERFVDNDMEGDDYAAQLRRYANVPLSAAVEVVSFGRISNMVGFLADREAVKAVAGTLGVQWDPFDSVVHSLSVLRNLCAHHRQLWHRRLDIQCPVQKKLRPRGIKFDPAGPYAAIIMASHYRKKADGDTAVADEISKLLEENPTYAAGIYQPQPK